MGRARPGAVYHPEDTGFTRSTGGQPCVNQVERSAQRSRGRPGDLAAAPASAGGWATILVDREASGTTGPAGEPVAVVFTVLQHGITPVDSEVATVVATDAATGGQVRVVARADGVAGRYRATLILPHEDVALEGGARGADAQSQFQDVTVTAGHAAPGQPGAPHGRRGGLRGCPFRRDRGRRARLGITRPPGAARPEARGAGRGHGALSLPGESG
jgi:hypothetical protein